MHKTDTGTIWNVTKRVRWEILTKQFRCGSNEMLNVQVAEVIAFEKYLGMKTSEIKLPNMSNVELKKAADPFTYLTFCPGKLNQWLLFYKDLLETRSPSQILLTLNRIMKKADTLNDASYLR